jgi:hypothetical protein
LCLWFFELAGLGIDWIATKNKALYKQTAQLKEYTTIYNNAPSKLFVTFVLKHKEVVLNRNLKIIADNLKVWDTFFGYQHVLTWCRPKALAIGFPQLNTKNFI